MKKYIDANNLQSQLERKKAGIANQRYTEGWNDCIMRVKSMVSKAPAADVALVVHGRWTPSESDFDVEEWCDWQCSACREDICYADPMPPRLLPKHCPNCGAKMDGGGHDGL